MRFEHGKVLAKIVLMWMQYINGELSEKPFWELKVMAINADNNLCRRFCRIHYALHGYVKVLYMVDDIKTKHEVEFILPS